MAENQLNRQLAAGIRAAQQGERERARELLEGVLRRDRNNEQGWIWLASVVESQRERRLSLERVLKINPNNLAAQEALNSMVGVLGSNETDNIDYARISASARTPMPEVRRRTGSSSATPPPDNSGRNTMPLLFGVAVVLGILLLGAIFVPPLLAPEPTETPLPTIVPTQAATVDPLYTPPSPTTRPTETLDPESVAGLSIEVTSLPTFTPTATIPPTETPLPTATIPPLADYNFLLVAVQGSASSSIYRLDGNGTGLANILPDVDDFDYHPETGLIVFTRRRFVDAPTQEVLPTSTPAPTSTPGGPTREAPAGIVIRPGVVQQEDQLEVQMFVTYIDDLDNRTEITSSTLPVAFAPSISPDGNYIAFASDVDGDAEIYVYDVATGLPSQITDNISVEDTHPDWSPDGTQLIFSSDRESAGNNDLFIIEPFADDPLSTIVQVTQSRGRNINPQWSPVTDELVFLNINGDETTLRLASIDGSLTRDLTFRPDWTYTSPSWSPDSNYIFYSSGSPDATALELRVYSPLTRADQSVRTINLNVLQVVPR